MNGLSTHYSNGYFLPELVQHVPEHIHKGKSYTTEEFKLSRGDWDAWRKLIDETPVPEGWTPPPRQLSLEQLLEECRIYYPFRVNLDLDTEQGNRDGIARAGQLDRYYTYIKRRHVGLGSCTWGACKEHATKMYVYRILDSDSREMKIAKSVFQSSPYACQPNYIPDDQAEAMKKKYENELEFLSDLPDIIELKHYIESTGLDYDDYLKQRSEEMKEWEKKRAEYEEKERIRNEKVAQVDKEALFKELDEVERYGEEHNLYPREIDRMRDAVWRRYYYFDHEDEGVWNFISNTLNTAGKAINRCYKVITPPLDEAFERVKSNLLEPPRPQVQLAIMVTVFVFFCSEKFLDIKGES